MEYLLDKHVQSVHASEDGTDRQTPSQRVSDRGTPKSQHPQNVKVKVKSARINHDISDTLTVAFSHLKYNTLQCNLIYKYSMMCLYILNLIFNVLG